MVAWQPRGVQLGFAVLGTGVGSTLSNSSEYYQLVTVENVAELNVTSIASMIKAETQLDASMAEVGCALCVTRSSRHQLYMRLQLLYNTSCLGELPIQKHRLM